MWVPVKERSPSDVPGLHGPFQVKTVEGSMSKSEHERRMFFKVNQDGYGRFLTGDWQVVTHWWDE